jgi:hypothetical protein
VPGHEEVARPLLTDGPIGQQLTSRFGASAPERVWNLVRGESDSPLQGLISGSLDLDKIEYLKRDALMCGVPYGEIDVDRLLNSLVVLQGTQGKLSVGVLEKGLSALESLLFAKYQMYRNVYWHHAVRSATAMYKRMVADALRANLISADSLTSLTDEGLIHIMRTVAPSHLLESLVERRLYKRSFEIPAAELGIETAEWIAEDPQLAMQAEDQLAAELGLKAGELLLDYPTKTQMLGVDIDVLDRSGRVSRLAPDGMRGAINLPSLSDRLYRSARWLRVFTVRRIDLPPSRLMKVLRVSRAEAAQLLRDGESLLS